MILINERVERLHYSETFLTVAGGKGGTREKLVLAEQCPLERVFFFFFPPAGVELIVPVFFRLLSSDLAIDHPERCQRS